MQKVTDSTIKMIIEFEGFMSNAYKPVASEKYYTIGYGHYGSDVKKSDTITKEKALDLLKNDLVKYANNVNKYDNVYHWTKSEFDALVSFAYNCGSIDQLTMNGKRSRLQIADKMLEYCHASGGFVLSGLKKRREKERKKFLTKHYTKNVVANSGLNIREKPNGDIIKAIPNNTNVLSLKNENGWVLIDCFYGTHLQGYVKGEYLK